MSRRNIKIAAVQETKLNENCSLQRCYGYNVLRKDRTRSGGGGLTFLLHHSVQYRPISLELVSSDPYMECVGVAVKCGTAEVEVLNVYIPPINSCEPRYLPDISPLLVGNNRLVLGDFNAHHELWHSVLGNDQRGSALAEQIDCSTFCTVNEDAPTRIRGECHSSPDLTIVSPGLINDVTWQPVISLGSDHLPIIVSISRSPDFITSERRTFLNHGKAHWPEFREFTNRRFRELPNPSDVRVAERIFRNIIRAAAARYIPAGRIPEIRPNFPAEAAGLANERDDLRRTNPTDPRISDLTVEVNRLVQEHKRKKWLDHLKCCNIGTDMSKLWVTVKSLSNPGKKDDRTSVTFNDVTVTDPKRCAEYFNRQFVEHPESDRAKRRVLRRIRSLPAEEEPPQFTMGDVANVIRNAKSSKALGPDGISMVMLKQLDTPGVEYLTKVLNLSLATHIVPEIWKMGRVVPLLKPGKDASKGESYRPISLLSPVAKTLEALLLPSIRGSYAVANHQHGFRPQHSTTTALHAISTHISRGLNQNRPCDRTVLVALDLSKAFDTVNHATLSENYPPAKFETLDNQLYVWTPVVRGIPEQEVQSP
ncbi:probable RNA-directed DNA polymerase from transposon BS isoform X1 [Musca domestica]|uniref:Probable RNA-directed DNA polymerase from transposon BS isoform X1 n=1 Tax=Musca domestica TaxID=7370 RepID=A0ABM3VAB9_MUSDO|nr:probable RNA-directed DNA polymerase from transposon BS isoform X1 [Musca domestica]